MALSFTAADPNSPATCSKCLERFTTYTEAQAHLQAVHKSTSIYNINPYPTCNVCGKAQTTQQRVGQGGDWELKHVRNKIFFLKKTKIDSLHI